MEDFSKSSSDLTEKKSSFDFNSAVKDLLAGKKLTGIYFLCALKKQCFFNKKIWRHTNAAYQRTRGDRPFRRTRLTYSQGRYQRQQEQEERLNL